MIPPPHLSQRLAVDVDLVVHVQLVVLQEAAPLGVRPLDLAEEATELLQFAQKVKLLLLLLFKASTFSPVCSLLCAYT